MILRVSDKTRTIHENVKIRHLVAFQIWELHRLKKATLVIYFRFI